MLSLKILLRALRAGELKTIFISLCLSVAVVAAVSIFAERIEKAIVNESKELLGSDFIVKSSKPIPQVWIEYASLRLIFACLSCKLQVWCAIHESNMQV